MVKLPYPLALTNLKKDQEKINDHDLEVSSFWHRDRLGPAILALMAAVLGGISSKCIAHRPIESAES